MAASVSGLLANRHRNSVIAIGARQHQTGHGAENCRPGFPQAPAIGVAQHLAQGLRQRHLKVRVVVRLNATLGVDAPDLHQQWCVRVQVLHATQRAPKRLEHHSIAVVYIALVQRGQPRTLQQQVAMKQLGSGWAQILDPGPGFLYQLDGVVVHVF